MNWPVYPHSPLEKLSPRLWRVEGSMPKSPMLRCMVIIKDHDGLIIHNAVACDEETMAQIDAIGPVHTIIFPNGLHRMDGNRFSKRYPEAKLFAPKGAVAEAQKKADKKVLPLSEMKTSDSFRFETVAGTAEKECVFVVSEKDELTLIFNDALFNHPHVSGFGGFILKLVGSSGSPRVTRVAKLLLFKNKALFKEQLVALAALPNLKRAIPGHGDVIDADVPKVLREVAEAI